MVKLLKSVFFTNFAIVNSKKTMKLVIMTRPTFFVEEDKILTTLFDEGLDNLHLYKPDSSPLYSERLLSLMPEEYYDRITVHEHYYLKDEYRLAGIHLPECDTPLPEGYKGKYSRTCSILENLKDARKKAKYVFLPGVFGSSHGGAAFTRDELKEASRHDYIDRHVYAMGGVTADNIREAKDLGFGGVVICSDLWNKFDIHRQQDFKELITYFEKLRRTV